MINLQSKMFFLPPYFFPVLAVVKGQTKKQMKKKL